MVFETVCMEDMLANCVKLIAKTANLPVVLLPSDMGFVITTCTVLAVHDFTWYRINMMGNLQ